MIKEIIGILLNKKVFENEDRRNDYLIKHNFKTNFRKKKPILKNDYYLYKQKDYIKYERIDTKTFSNNIKLIIGYKNKDLEIKQKKIKLNKNK